MDSPQSSPKAIAAKGRLPSREKGMIQKNTSRATPSSRRTNRNALGISSLPAEWAIHTTGATRTVVIKTLPSSATASFAKKTGRGPVGNARRNA